MTDTTNLCPGCTYDLRGHDAASEFCPECGAYLVPESDGAAPRAPHATMPPVVLRKTLSTDDTGILLRNATLPPAEVTRHLRNAAGAAEVVNVVGIGVLAMALAIGIAGLLSLASDRQLPMMVDDHPILSLAIFVGVLLLVYRFVVKAWLVRKFIERRVRTTLRQAGHDVCSGCGWCFTPEQASACECPNCGRDHVRHITPNV